MVSLATPLAPARGGRRPALRPWLVPLGIFALTRLLDGVLIALVATRQAAVGHGIGPFVVHPMPASPGYLTALTNWDGQWYAQIALHGYPSTLPRHHGAVVQNVWAFYPLFPGAVRGVMQLSGLSFAVAATLVSTLCGAAAMILLHRMLRRTAGLFTASMTVLALCMFPSGPVLQAAYTESMSLLVVLACLWLLRERRYGWLAVATVVLSLTRPIVLPIAVVIAVHGVVRWRHRDEHEFAVRERWACALAAATAAVSFLIWPVVVAIGTGEARAYFLTQQAWLPDPTDHGWPSWLAHLTGGAGLGTGLLAVYAVGLAAYLSLRKRAAPWGVELRAWAPVYLLYLAGTTRPTPSVVRYAMLAIVPWWPVPSTEPEQPERRVRVALVAAVVIVGAIAQLVWLWACWIPRPGGNAYP
jgi:hypothetical protein